MMTNSSWTKRLLIAVPFAIAALLNALMVGVEHFHLRFDYIARYGFVFSWPWAWLADFADITSRLNVQNQWLRGFIFHVALLWIPAVHSVCVWLLLVILGIAMRPWLNRRDPDVVRRLKRKTAITSSIVLVAAVSWVCTKALPGSNCL